MSKFNIYCKFDISYSIYQFQNKDIIVLEGDYHPLLMSDFFDMKVLHYECSKLHLFSLFVLNATNWNFEKKKMWKVDRDIREKLCFKVATFESRSVFQISCPNCYHFKQILTPHELLKNFYLVSVYVIRLLNFRQYAKYVVDTKSMRQKNVDNKYSKSYSK